MKNESLIHLRVEYENALESKKDVLFAEMNLLNIMKVMKNYHALRIEELELKSQIHKKLKEVDHHIKKLETTLPKVVLPKILKKEEEVQVEKKPKEVKEKVETKKVKEEKKYDSTLESQLQAIQDKLKALQH